MATIKAFSVARTQKSYTPGTPTPASGVYSFSGTHAGRNGADDHATAEGGQEGRTPTMVVSGQSTAQQAEPLTDANGGPATALTLAALGAGTLDWAAGRYVVTTTNQGDVTGAGLLVAIDVAANGAVTISTDNTLGFGAGIVNPGEGYNTDDGDVVTLDIGVANNCTVTGT
jgi:hypothetical protein